MKNRILVVDDEEHVRFTFKVFLEKEDYDVVLAEDYTSALDILKTDSIDLVVTDIIMGKRTGVDLLKEIKESRGQVSDFVFPGRSPEAPRKDLKAFWRSVLTKAGISDYRIHDNRHTHASHLVSSGMSLAIVGRLLGHTNPSTTQRYAHLADDPLREASEIMGRKFSDRKT